MEYLDVDLNNVLWNKLDYSGVKDMSIVKLFDKPVIFDSVEESDDFISKHHLAISWMYSRNSMLAVLAYTDQEECAYDDTFELSKIYGRNVELMQNLIGGTIMITVNNDADYDKYFRLKYTGGLYVF